MSDLRDAIEYLLSSSLTLMDSFLSDLTPSDWLHRPTPKANCAAWTIGHLILTERRVLGRVGVKDLPDLPEGFDKRFARDEVAPSATDYGDVSILRPLFNETRRRLIDAARALSLAELDAPVGTPHPRFKTIGELLQFMAIHSSMHAGQISTIRRSLGRPPVV